jgi:hypothetical protein
MITNLLIADFLKCRQRAYLALAGRTDIPTELELHHKRVAKYIMDRFTRAHESQIIQNCMLDALRPSGLAHLSRPVYIIGPSSFLKIAVLS